jgi:hypothetical protein
MWGMTDDANLVVGPGHARKIMGRSGDLSAYRPDHSETNYQGKEWFFHDFFFLNAGVFDSWFSIGLKIRILQEIIQYWFYVLELVFNKEMRHGGYLLARVSV